MVAIDRDTDAEPVFSDRFISKMDPWLRSLDPLSEFVFRTALQQQHRCIRANRQFAKRCKELKARLTPTEAEQAVILERVKRLETQLAALLPS